MQSSKLSISHAQGALEFASASASRSNFVSTCVSALLLPFASVFTAISALASAPASPASCFHRSSSLKLPHIGPIDL
jgi:hypothetical protein